MLVRLGTPEEFEPWEPRGRRLSLAFVFSVPCFWLRDWKSRGEQSTVNWIPVWKSHLSRVRCRRAGSGNSGNELYAVCNLTLPCQLEYTFRSWVGEFIWGILLFFSLSAEQSFLVKIQSLSQLFSHGLSVVYKHHTGRAGLHFELVTWRWKFCPFLLIILLHEVVVLHWLTAPLVFCAGPYCNLWLQNKCSVFFLCVDIDLFFFFKPGIQMEPVPAIWISLIRRLAQIYQLTFIDWTQVCHCVGGEMRFPCLPSYLQHFVWMQTHFPNSRYNGR